MNHIWTIIGAGLGGVVGLVVCLLLHKGQKIIDKHKKELAEIRKKRIEVKEEYIDNLKKELSAVMAESNSMRSDLVSTAKALVEYQRKGDMDSARTCDIRGRIVLEQVEATISRADEILSELEREMKLLGELENEAS